MLGLDYSEERFVRLYTRDTEEWNLFAWQARALYPLMERKCYRSGVLPTKHGPRGVAAMVSLPLDVVENGLKDLLQFGWVSELSTPPGYQLVEFRAAQEAHPSAAQRQRESRERRRDHDTE